MSLSSLNSIGQSVFELESGNENVDGQTDGHINLIGGLVTCNPPKNHWHYLEENFIQHGHVPLVERGKWGEGWKLDVWAVLLQVSLLVTQSTDTGRSLQQEWSH